MVKLEELFKGHSKTPEMILSELMTKENIEMKTEIHQPINLAKLYIIGQALVDMKLPKSGNLIHNFITRYLEYMVSHDRMGRKEIIEALTVSEMIKNNREREQPPVG